MFLRHSVAFIIHAHFQARVFHFIDKITHKQGNRTAIVFNSLQQKLLTQHRLNIIEKLPACLAFTSLSFVFFHLYLFREFPNFLSTSFIYIYSFFFVLFFLTPSLLLYLTAIIRGIYQLIATLLDSENPPRGSFAFIQMRLSLVQRKESHFHENIPFSGYIQSMKQESVRFL